MLLVTGAGCFCGADYFGIQVEAKLCNCLVCGWLVACPEGIHGTAGNSDPRVLTQAFCKTTGPAASRSISVLLCLLGPAEGWERQDLNCWSHHKERCEQQSSPSVQLQQPLPFGFVSSCEPATTSTILTFPHPPDPLQPISTSLQAPLPPPANAIKQIIVHCYWWGSFHTHSLIHWERGLKYWALTLK